MLLLNLSLEKEFALKTIITVENAINALMVCQYYV